MDRRFDRLERTKADRIDLRRFASKKDLRRFATQKDVRRFATRAELRREVANLRGEMRLWAADIKRHFDVVAEGFDAKLQKLADGVAEIAAIKLHVAHHGAVLDEHETRTKRAS
jgi:hypothetical protein